MFELDCTGLSCPIPVVNTKRALKEHLEGLKVAVDNRAAFENVSRFAQTMRYNISSEEKDGLWIITIKK